MSSLSCARIDSVFSQGWLASLITASPDPILVLDEDGVIVCRNGAAAAFFGDVMTPGRTLLDRVDFEDRAALAALLDRGRLLQTPTDEKHAFGLRLADDSIAWCAVSRMPLLIGEELRFCLIFKDMLPPLMLAEAHPLERSDTGLGEVLLIARSGFLGAHVETVLRRHQVDFRTITMHEASAPPDLPAGHHCLVYCAAAIAPEDVQALRAIRADNSKIRILVASLASSQTYDLEIIRAGANGIIDSEENLEQTVRALHAIFDGEIWCPRSLMSRLLESASIMNNHGIHMTDAPFGLTRREREVIELLCQNRTNKEIAGALDIATTTIVSHLFNIYRKLNVSNRYQAIQFAFAHRMVEPPLNPS